VLTVCNFLCCLSLTWTFGFSKINIELNFIVELYIYIYSYHLFYIKHQHTDKSIFELFMFVLYFHFTVSEITNISLTVRILYNYEYIRVSYEPKLINIFWR